jgi:hypothetical protein
LLLALATVQAGCSSDDALARDLAGFPRAAGKDRVNIDMIAAKHIPPGTSLDQSKAFLSERGFKIHQYTGRNVPEGQQWWVARKEESAGVILAEEYRFILESDGTTVLKSRGWIFLKGI